MTNYITYLRVSTQHQGANGLGMDAQRATIKAFARGGDIIAEYVEVESGRKSDRPQLALALAHAKRAKATLLVAKLDRLARDNYFVSGLLKTKVDFIACDFPGANKMTIQLMSVVAEWEAEQASIRTKAALAQAKARGVKLGGDSEAARAGRQAAKMRRNVTERARAIELRANGMTLAQIGQNLSTPAKTWHPTQVRRLLA